MKQPAGLRVWLAGRGWWWRLILRDLLHLGCEVLVADRSEEARRHAINSSRKGA